MLGESSWGHARVKPQVSGFRILAAVYEQGGNLQKSVHPSHGGVSDLRGPSGRSRKQFKVDGLGSLHPSYF